jgi:hypothetical protein
MNTLNEQAIVYANLIELGTRIRASLQNHPKLARNNFADGESNNVIAQRLATGVARDAEECK